MQMMNHRSPFDPLKCVCHLFFSSAELIENQEMGQMEMTKASFIKKRAADLSPLYVLKMS